MTIVRRALVVVGALLLMQGEAWSQGVTPEPASGPNALTGAFCGSTTLDMTLRELEQENRTIRRNTQPLPSALPIYQQKCQVGDIIHIPISEVLVIGSLCDFDRSIVNTGRMILCVYGSARTFR
jgi:hypothetical protein